MKQKTNKALAPSILSLSLLTVMAGAAVAPALNIISEHFEGTNPILIQLIVSLPAVFIVLTNFIFPSLCKHIKAKSLVLIGLLLYTGGGCIAGLFENIYFVLCARALVGVGVGIIMPLSTGLLSYHFDRDKQEKLMGYSSAMNQMGGVIATLLSGFLAQINWSLSFLVYLMGLISIVLCLLFVPNEKIHSEGGSLSFAVARRNWPCIAAIFFLMVSFFVFPTNYALESAKDGVIPTSLVAVIMAGMDLVAFAGGLLFVYIKKVAKTKTRFVSPVLFVVGFLFLLMGKGLVPNIVGAIFIGFANGEGIPYIMSVASKNEGKLAALTVMPLISAGLYLAQFTTPFIVSAFSALLAFTGIAHIPYVVPIISGCLFFAVSLFATEKEPYARDNQSAK